MLSLTCSQERLTAILAGSPFWLVARLDWQSLFSGRNFAISLFYGCHQILADSHLWLAAILAGSSIFWKVTVGCKPLLADSFVWRIARIFLVGSPSFCKLGRVCYQRCQMKVICPQMCWLIILQVCGLFRYNMLVLPNFVLAKNV